MKGRIIHRGESFYTDLGKLFKKTDNIQKQYNWLITDCQAYPQNEKYHELLSREYAWISGEDLTKMTEQEDFQWIWAVLSGFEKDITEAEVLKYPLPYADGYRGFWENPISIQHPLAETEITAWDGTASIIISANPKIYDLIELRYPLSEDLQEYNKT